MNCFSSLIMQMSTQLIAIGAHPSERNSASASSPIDGHSLDDTFTSQPLRPWCCLPCSHEHLYFVLLFSQNLGPIYPMPVQIKRICFPSHTGPLNYKRMAKNSQLCPIQKFLVVGRRPYNLYSSNLRLRLSGSQLLSPPARLIILHCGICIYFL